MHARVCRHATLASFPVSAVHACAYLPSRVAASRRGPRLRANGRASGGRASGRASGGRAHTGWGEQKQAKLAHTSTHGPGEARREHTGARASTHDDERGKHGHTTRRRWHATLRVSLRHRCRHARPIASHATLRVSPRPRPLTRCSNASVAAFLACQHFIFCPNPSSYPFRHCARERTHVDSEVDRHSRGLWLPRGKASAIQR